MSMKYDKLPTLLILKFVECTDHDQRASGGFADVFCGTYAGAKVGLKRFRVYAAMSDEERQSRNKVRPFTSSPVY